MTVPGRQFESLDRPNLDRVQRTRHGQQREGERDVDPATIERVLKEGVRLPDKNRPGHHVYVWTHPQTGERYKVAHAPEAGVLPTVMHDDVETSRQDTVAAQQRVREQNTAAAQSSRQTRTNKAAQEEKQARRDWAQRFSGEFPGMDGYKAAKASAKRK